jgi:hypothetical protein
MTSVYHIVTIRVNETSYAHVWRLHFRYFRTGYDTTPRSSHSSWNTNYTRCSADWVMPTTSVRDTCSSVWRQGRPMTTSNSLLSSSSSSSGAAAPICFWEEDAPPTGLALAGASPTAVAPVVESDSGPGTLSSWVAHAAESRGHHPRYSNGL